MDIRASNPESPVSQVTVTLPGLQRRRLAPPISLRLTTSERKLLLALFDLLTVNAALLGTLVLRYDYSFSWATLGEAPWYFLLLSALWAVWASFFDCYDLPRAADASQSAWSAGRAALLAALTYLAIPFPPLASRPIFLLDW
jgi:hypothetical protein